AAATDSVLHRVIKQLRSCLAYAVDVELVDRNIAAKTKMPKPRTAKRPRWTADEVRKLLPVARAYGHTVGHYAYVAVMTGMRREELRGLRWQDVDLEQRTLTIAQVVVDEKGKLVVRNQAKTEAGQRSVHFDEGTRQVLLAQRELQAL